MSEFLLSCESTVDMPYSYIESRGVSVLFYKYTVNGQDYDDDMGRDPEGLKRFYGFIADGNIPTTSQINIYGYTDYLEGLLKDHDKVLHICLGTGMTGSYNNANAAAMQLNEKYPDKELIVINSTCSSTGYGLLVDYAADLRDEGKSMDEVVEWVEAHKRKVHHQFYAVDLQYYKRTGRMSGPTATLAAVLNICPIMRLDYDGRIIAYDKVRGEKRAIERTIKTMAEHAEGGYNYSGKCFICHSERPEDAERTREELAKAFPNIKGEIKICDIGTIIASHCGPGTLAVFFLGDDRKG